MRLVPVRHYPLIFTSTTIQGAGAAPKTPGKTPSKELAAKSSSIEALKRDPLRNFQQQPLAPPPVPSLATFVSTGSKLPSTFTSSKPFPGASSPPKNKITSLPAVKANELLEIDLSLYTVADGTELNPAEQRTMRLGLSSKAWPAPPVHLLLAAPTLSTGSHLDTSGDLSIDNVSGGTGRHREATTSVNFSGEPTSLTSNTRRSRASLATNRDPTVTINTKEGLKDVYGFFNSPTKSMKLEGIEESVRKPPKAAMKTVEFSENAGVPPTPTPGTFKMEDENAMSVKKGGESCNISWDRRILTTCLWAVFRPFSENETPAPNRTSDPTGLAFQPPPSGASCVVTRTIIPCLHPIVLEICLAGAGKTPGTAKRGLALKHMTPAAEPAPAPVLESQETDEDEYEGEGALPDTETPFARKKPAVGFVPFSDDAPAPATKVLQIFEDTSSTPAPAPKGLQIFEDVAELEDEGPLHEKDLFAVQDTQNRHSAFRPFRGHESLNGGDEAGEEDGHDVQQEGEGYLSETQEEPYSDGEGEEEDEQQPAAGGRWAPALTPITERTYEPTSTFSNRWTTPLEQRDQSVADPGTFAFDGTEAARAAARLAEELRAEEEEETRDLQRMQFAKMYRRESIGLHQSLGDSGEIFTNWTEEGESRVGGYSVREDGTLEGEEEEGESSRIEPPEVIDPYTTQTLSEILVQLEIPPTHRDLRPATANRLDKLQKTFKTRGRANGNTSRGSHKNTSGPDEVFLVDLDGENYDILGKLGEGGFGAVFLATDVAAYQRLEDEREDAEAFSKVAVKVVKPAMVWESYALDLIHQNVDPFVLPSIIKPHSLYIFGDESYLVLDYSHYGTLLEAVNRSGELGIGQGLGGVATSIPGMDEMLAMFFAVELLRTVEGLHRAGFIHGDLKIDNCMVRLDPSPPGGLDSQYDPSGAGGWSTKGIRLIDFGRTIDTSLFPPGQQFTTDWKVDKRDCLEMRQKLPWTYETDYYGLVGIVYCLLYGKYMEMPALKDVDGRVTQKLPSTLKRYWRVDIWEPFFDMLLNPHQFGTELPIVDELSSIRGRMEAWLVDNSAKSTRKSSLIILLKRLATAHV